jgi:hypothetical protein
VPSAVETHEGTGSLALLAHFGVVCWLYDGLGLVRKEGEAGGGQQQRGKCYAGGGQAQQPQVFYVPRGELLGLFRSNLTFFEKSGLRRAQITEVRHKGPTGSLHPQS